MDFTPQQKYSLLSKMGYSGSMQGDEMDKFLQSNPGAAAKMGKFDRAMKRGFSQGGLATAKKSFTNAQNELIEAERIASAWSIAKIETKEVKTPTKEVKTPTKKASTPKASSPSSTNRDSYLTEYNRLKKITPKEMSFVERLRFSELRRLLQDSATKTETKEVKTPTKKASTPTKKTSTPKASSPSSTNRDSYLTEYNRLKKITPKEMSFVERLRFSELRRLLQDR